MHQYIDFGSDFRDAAWRGRAKRERSWWATGFLNVEPTFGAHTHNLHLCGCVAIPLGR